MVITKGVLEMTTIYDDLLKQYNRATNNNCKDIYDKEFKKWLDSYSYDLGAYIEFLESNGYEFKKSNIAELDKGPFDSILVRRGAYNLKDRLITENAANLKIPRRRLKVAKKEIKVYHNGQLFPIDEYDKYMSYNLSSRSQLMRFSLIHNLGKDVLYGTFGKMTDFDKRTKLEDVQSIYKNMFDGEFNLNYYESEGSYFYMVGSK